MGEGGVKNEGGNKLNTEHDAKILITQSYHVLLLIGGKKKRICAFSGCTEQKMTTTFITTA